MYVLVSYIVQSNDNTYLSSALGKCSKSVTFFFCFNSE